MAPLAPPPGSATSPYVTPLDATPADLFVASPYVSGMAYVYHTYIYSYISDGDLTEYR